MPPPDGFDVILFQESSQYIDILALFSKAYMLLAPGGVLLLVDEVVKCLEDWTGPSLHPLQHLQTIAPRCGFAVEAVEDLSLEAAPTLNYKLHLADKHGHRLQADMGISNEQMQYLICRHPIACIRKDMPTGAMATHC